MTADQAESLAASALHIAQAADRLQNSASAMAARLDSFARSKRTDPTTITEDIRGACIRHVATLLSEAANLADMARRMDLLAGRAFGKAAEDAAAELAAVTS